MIQSLDWSMVLEAWPPPTHTHTHTPLNHYINYGQ